jgi:nucleotide-binding universal stress UspA family protein
MREPQNVLLLSKILVAIDLSAGGEKAVARAVQLADEHRATLTIGGALPLLWLCCQALRYPNPRRIEAEAKLPRMLYTYDSEPGK